MIIAICHHRHRHWQSLLLCRCEQSHKFTQITRRVVKLFRFFNKATFKWMIAVDWMGAKKNIFMEGNAICFSFLFVFKRKSAIFSWFLILYGFWTISLVFVHFFPGQFASLSIKSIFWTNFFYTISFLDFDSYSMNFQLCSMIFL